MEASYNCISVHGSSHEINLGSGKDNELIGIQEQTPGAEASTMERDDPTQFLDTWDSRRRNFAFIHTSASVIRHTSVSRLFGSQDTTFFSAAVVEEVVEVEEGSASFAAFFSRRACANREVPSPC
ncbi:hypothetical protein CEP51_002222 [Fusarium floridanum]|uniref:Uncharacterized protein n=1 Tax=Fusarium floridanum TaxID=1325733 RepID=A0A428SCJ5_9HYPO|nr:hypothetical protein CEP51_002222 [Fusarium floridanum]